MGYSGGLPGIDGGVPHALRSSSRARLLPRSREEASSEWPVGARGRICDIAQSLSWVILAGVAGTCAIALLLR